MIPHDRDISTNSSPYKHICLVNLYVSSGYGDNICAFVQNRSFTFALRFMFSRFRDNGRVVWEHASARGRGPLRLHSRAACNRCVCEVICHISIFGTSMCVYMMYGYVCVHTYICIYTHIYMCVCCVCIYIYTHTHQRSCIFFISFSHSFCSNQNQCLLAMPAPPDWFRRFWKYSNQSNGRVFPFRRARGLNSEHRSRMCESGTTKLSK